MKRKQWILLEIVAVVPLLLISFMYMLPRFIDAQNINTPENFPDPNFRRVIEKNMGVKEGGIFSALQAANKKSLEFYRQGITNAKGLEFFTGLEILDITHTDIKELNLSNNTKLKMLVCRNNQLKSLDVSTLTQLSTLYCENNQIQFLDVSNHPHLWKLFCSENPLKELDTGISPNLIQLHVKNTNINKLDISQFISLEDLNVAKCKLSEIDVSNNSRLTYLNASGNYLEEVPSVFNPAKMANFDISNNSLDCGDWEKVTDLKSIYEEILFSQVFQFSPQKGLDPYDCAETEN